ncbi:unnamed protein product [Paramecium primaurelia]|uniref:Uncharacterized protein n=1 Tax=Paramecium primaurelia TaxID=5886 RepID=A0A8S1KEQ5_PARPR|nr:unnamed protein product [Paramecium primaurelia]
MELIIPYLFLNFKTFQLQYYNYQVEMQLINFFQKVLSLIWIGTIIEKLWAAKYKEICDLYRNLLNHLQLLSKLQIQKKIAENLIIPNSKENQHFPEMKTKFTHYNIYKIHKYQYYYEGCCQVKTGKSGPYVWMVVFLNSNKTQLDIQEKEKNKVYINIFIYKNIFINIQIN